MRRKNGFSFPLHPLQILSWLLTLWHTFIPIIFLILSSNSDPLCYVFPVLFYTSQIFVVLLAFNLTKSDPSQSPSIDSNYLSTSEQYTFYCTVCKYYVPNESRHCAHCDKCIEGFDHHCKWLNTCIGKNNYRKFIYLLLFTEVNLGILFGFEAFFLKESSRILIFFIYADMAFTSVPFCLVGYLIGFHIYLRFEGITTYDYIKRKRNEKKISPKEDKSCSVSKKVYISKSVEFIKTKDENNLVQSVSKEDLGASISDDN